MLYLSGNLQFGQIRTFLWENVQIAINWAENGCTNYVNTDGMKYNGLSKKIQEIKLWNCIVICDRDCNFQQPYDGWKTANIYTNCNSVLYELSVLQEFHCCGHSMTNTTYSLDFDILYANVHLRNLPKPKTHFMWLNSIRIVLQTSL